jgi:hypothetical protein
MELRSILFIIFILILLYIIVKLIYSTATAPLSPMQDGTTMTTVAPTSLSGGSSGSNSGNFSYSIWFYINDWNYRYGEPKVIFGRMGAPSSSGEGAVSGVSGNDPCPSVVLGAVQNNLTIALSCYPGANSSSESTSKNSVVHTCNVANVPVQRWVNLLVSVYGRSMDVYIDGKLVKTCLLPGVAKINTKSPIYVTPNGGFSGWTGNFQYWPKPTDPQTAWNIYSQGYGGSFNLSQLKLKVAVYQGSTETGSLTI